jgi:hypothetical protein
MKAIRIFVLIIFSVALVGCKCELAGNQTHAGRTYKAVFADSPVEIDGKPDDKIWESAPSYPLFLSEQDAEKGRPLQERGHVKFAWDEEYFYLAADFEDSDVLAQGTQDQMHHYSYGDVCELFLKPAGQSYYWELYVTPAGNKSSFFFPSKGHLGLADCYSKYIMDSLRVAADIKDGTLNSWQDRDNGWTAEMAVPVKAIEAYGCDFGAGADWTILAARYNYSRYLIPNELSMTPRLTATSYHLIDEYARLELVK